MAIAKVQIWPSGPAATSGAATAQSASATSNPTVANYIVAWVWGFNGAANYSAGGSDTITLSDSDGGNTWVVPGGSIATTHAGAATNVDLYCALAYTKVAHTSANFKVTATITSSQAGCSIMLAVAEFSGVLAASPEDGSLVGATGTSQTAIAPGSKTSIASGSLICAVMSSDDATNPAHINGVTTGQPGTPPTSWTAVNTEYQTSTLQAGQAIYSINLGSSLNPTWTIAPDTSAKFGAAQFGLKAAAAAGGPLFLNQGELSGMGVGGPFFRNPIGRREERGDGQPRRRRRAKYVELGVG